MSIKSAPYYWLECDGCGVRHAPGGGEYSAMADAAYVVDEAVDEDDWTTDGQRHHCPTCPALFRCEICGSPASGPDDPSDLCGERDYHCKPCWQYATTAKAVDRLAKIIEGTIDAR